MLDHFAGPGTAVILTITFSREGVGSRDWQFFPTEFPLYRTCQELACFSSTHMVSESNLNIFSGAEDSIRGRGIH